jgi:hypothetical protein
MYPKLRINPRGEVCDLHLFPERRTPELAVIGYGAVFDCEGPQLRFKMGPQGRKDCPQGRPEDGQDRGVMRYCSGSPHASEATGLTAPSLANQKGPVPSLRRE